MVARVNTKASVSTHQSTTHSYLDCIDYIKDLNTQVLVLISSTEKEKIDVKVFLLFSEYLSWADMLAHVHAHNPST